MFINRCQQLLLTDQPAIERVGDGLEKLFPSGFPIGSNVQKRAKGRRDAKSISLLNILCG